MTPGSATTRGVLVYTSRVVREWSEATARKEIAELHEMGAAEVALCVEASKGWRADHGVLVDVADHLRHAGFRVGVYALPSREAWLRPEALADRLAAAGIACRATRWVPDIEEQARGLGPQVRRFRHRLTDLASERVAITVTLYGKIPRQPSPRDVFPWAEVVGWGELGYQLYLTAEDDERVESRLADAEVHWGPDVTPYVGTYLGDAARLDRDIRNACTDAAGNVVRPRLGIWQDSTTSRPERRVIAGWAERFRDARADEITQRVVLPGER